MIQKFFNRFKFLIYIFTLPLICGSWINVYFRLRSIESNFRFWAKQRSYWTYNDVYFNIFLSTIFRLGSRISRLLLSHPFFGNKFCWNSTLMIYQFLDFSVFKRCTKKYHAIWLKTEKNEIFIKMNWCILTLMIPVFRNLHQIRIFVLYYCKEISKNFFPILSYLQFSYRFW